MPSCRDRSPFSRLAFVSPYVIFIQISSYIYLLFDISQRHLLFSQSVLLDQLILHLPHK